MKEMTHKERIDAVLSGQAVDRTPFGLVDGGAWIAYNNNETYRQFYSRPDGGASEIVKYTNEIDTDIVSSVNGVFTAALSALGCSIDIDTLGSPCNTGTCITDLAAEVGSLDKSTIREKLLADDFFQKMLNQCKSVKALIGDEKYLIGDIAGPFTMGCVMLGTAKFLKAIKKTPDLVKQLLDFSTAFSAEVLHLLHDAGCDIAFVAEPVASGDLIGPPMYMEWALPALKNLKAELSEYKYFFAHVCGGSGKRVTPLMEAGVNAFSCDYLVDLDQALIDADGKMTMFGNLNPAGKLYMGNAEDVYEEACNNIKTAAGRPYILAPGCDLSCTTKYDNVMAMSRACKDMAK